MIPVVVLRKIKVRKKRKGLLGLLRTAKIKAYAPSTHTQVAEIAGYITGVCGEKACAFHTHHHRGEKLYVLMGREKGYDEVAYDAFIGVLGGILSRKYGIDGLDRIYCRILSRTGQKTGEVHYSPEPVGVVFKGFRPSKHRTVTKGIAVQLPSFDELTERLGKKVNTALLKEIFSRLPEASKSEREKIARTIEIAESIAKELAKTYGNPDKVPHIGIMKIEHPDIALSALAYLNVMHPLGVIGDHILQLKELHPDHVHPEKIYGAEWYRFLKKKAAEPMAGQGGRPEP